MGPNSLMQGFVVAGAAPAQHVTDPLKNIADKVKGQKDYKILKCKYIYGSIKGQFFLVG